VGRVIFYVVDVDALYELGRSRDGFRLYHGNHRIDMHRFAEKL
jgi:hypothetical protein